MTNLYETLYQARKDKGLTQAELAELMQLGQSYLSQIERGRHDIRVNTLIELARLLDLEVMLVPRQNVPAVSYLITSRDERSEDSLPPAYGPLPDEV